jgi:hypothetical protein
MMPFSAHLEEHLEKAIMKLADFLVALSAKEAHFA